MIAGRYHVRRRLGSGGMATVFMAEDERLGREVAVKRLHTSVPEDSLRRFRREARLGAALNHPNLVAVFDTIASEDDALIVMEYVPGHPLSEEIGGAGMDPSRALDVLRQLADALDHAHGAGVVHRDVKPANVLIRDDGVVKLTDLGIARAVDQTQITREDQVVGTLPYMAPERLEGPGRGGPESDVYSLAALAFEMLSGRRPPVATTGSGGARARSTLDLTQRWPQGPAPVIGVLRRGLARNPGSRPESPSQLVEELAAALDRTTAPEPTTLSATAPLPERLRVRPAAAGAGGVSHRAAALVVVLASVAVLAAAGIALTGGGDGGDGSAGERAAEADRQPEAGPSEGKPPSSEAADSSSAAPPSGPASEGAAGVDPAEGARLNSVGFELINQGRYEEAIPVLQRAVASFPEGSSDLNYAYALFNLGNALRLAGRPDEAIPILERRLEIPNQTGTVRRELELARREAAA